MLDNKEFQFRYRVADLLEEVKPEGVGFAFSDKARAMVKELAEYARSTELYKQSEDIRHEWLSNNEVTPYTVYVHMLDRIVKAPTTIHMISSAILMLPILDEALEAERAIREEQV